MGRFPVVLTRVEVETFFAHLSGTPRLVAGLLYGSGLRLMETLRLRVKAMGAHSGQVTVCSGKGRRTA